MSTVWWILSDVSPTRDVLHVAADRNSQREEDVASRSEKLFIAFPPLVCLRFQIVLVDPQLPFLTLKDVTQKVISSKEFFLLSLSVPWKFDCIFFRKRATTSRLRTWEQNLGRKGECNIDVIDDWSMLIIGIFRGKFVKKFDKVLTLTSAAVFNVSFAFCPAAPFQTWVFR